MRVGLIGLGIMGKPMAKNILKAGYDLCVFDLNKPNVDEVVACGAKTASSEEIGKTCDVVLTMLPNGPQVKQVMLGENGVANFMQPGSTYIDMSSISPLVAKEVAEVLEKKGIDMLDSPVSGGEPMAINGTLSFMVGGKQEVFDKYKALLSCMGASVVLCGDVGAGNTTKLANQVIVAINIAAVSEAMMLAKKAGVDPELVFNAIKGGLAGSNVMNAKFPMINDHNFKPGFRIDLHIKDLTNALDCGHSVGAPLPLTAQMMEVFQTLRSDGCGSDDHSAIAKYYEKITGTQIGK